MALPIPTGDEERVEPNVHQLGAELDQLLARHHRELTMYLHEHVLRGPSVGVPAVSNDDALIGIPATPETVCQNRFDDIPDPSSRAGPGRARSNPEISVSPVGVPDSVDVSLEAMVMSSHVPRQRSSRELVLKQRWGTDRRSRLLRLISSWRYETAISFLIFANAIVSAWQTHHRAQHRKSSSEVPNDANLDISMYIFCPIFVADIGLRIVAQGSSFLRVSEWKWNIFDLVAVLGYVIEVAFSLGVSGYTWMSSAPVLRVVRIVRVVRVVQALRSFVAFRDLRITVSMLCDAMLPLTTFSVILSLVLMVFAMFFTDGVTSHLASHGEHEALTRYYADLFLTMSTLFKAITGGVDWEVVSEPLTELSWPYPAAFYAFVMFSLVAMFNVISAVFVDYVLNQSKFDRDFIIQTEVQSKRDFLKTMDRLFDDLDMDGSGKISLEDLRARLMNTEVNAHFRAIDLNVLKVRQLFQLMDSDDSGDIDKEEFLQGCNQLKGESKQLDVAIIQYEVRRIKELVLKLLDHQSPASPGQVSRAQGAASGE